MATCSIYVNRRAIYGTKGSWHDQTVGVLLLLSRRIQSYQLATYPPELDQKLLFEVVVIAIKPDHVGHAVCDAASFLREGRLIILALWSSAVKRSLNRRKSLFGRALHDKHTCFHWLRSGGPLFERRGTPYPARSGCRAAQLKQREKVDRAESMSRLALVYGSCGDHHLGAIHRRVSTPILESSIATDLSWPPMKAPLVTDDWSRSRDMPSSLTVILNQMSSTFISFSGFVVLKGILISRLSRSAEAMSASTCSSTAFCG